jgi:hypothetical protein
LGSSGKEFLQRTHPKNTEFDSQREQHLTSAHASTHESDYKKFKHSHKKKKIGK